MATAKIGGQEIPLLFDMDAWERIVKEMCPLGELMDKLRDSAKQRLSFEAAERTLRLTEILARSAGMEVTYERLKKAIKPGETFLLQLAVFDAITDGLTFEQKQTGGPRDLVLEELNTQKKTTA